MRIMLFTRGVWLRSIRFCRHTHTYIQIVVFPRPQTTPSSMKPNLKHILLCYTPQIYRSMRVVEPRWNALHDVYIYMVSTSVGHTKISSRSSQTTHTPTTQNINRQFKKKIINYDFDDDPPTKMAHQLDLPSRDEQNTILYNNTCKQRRRAKITNTKHEVTTI